MKRKINGVIAVLCGLIAIIFCLRNHLKAEWPAVVVAVGVGALHLYLAFRKPIGKRPVSPHQFHSQIQSSAVSETAVTAPRSVLTELILLGEEGDHLTTWNIYGKNGVVIGRDVGENQVTVDLNESAYASMIDVEHAVMNFTGEDWYIEDISEQNGVSIRKQDGRKYKLSYGKPCRLERGDIIYIAMARLQIA